MKKHFLSICAALFALMVLCSVTTRAADNVYAILYDDGTLVFQHGNTPESGKTVTKTYEVDLNTLYDNYAYNPAPWYNERESVRVVNFADKISPKATAFWFVNCENLERVDNVRNLDTVNVTNMRYMFSGCSRLMALDVSHFDTANVTSMWSMFNSCSGLTALDVSHFDTANVQYMHSMFSGCSGLTALDVSHFDTTNVQYIHSMFSGCSRLTALDLSNFDTAKVEDMEGMFSGCSELKLICASDKFTTASVLETEYFNSRNMFKDCTSLVGGNGTKYDSEHTDKEYARIDTPSAPGYFTASKPQPEPQPEPETYIITAYAEEGGTVTPDGDTRVRAGDSQKYTITPNPGYAVRSVRVDGADMGALSEYTFKNVIKDHTLSAFFEKLPRYAITAAVAQKGELSVTLENSAAVTVAVSYFDKKGQFLSLDLQNVSANAGSVTFALPFAYAARVALFDTDFRPLCDPVTAE